MELRHFLWEAGRGEVGGLVPRSPPHPSVCAVLKPCQPWWAEDVAGTLLLFPKSVLPVPTPGSKPASPSQDALVYVLDFLATCFLIPALYSGAPSNSFTPILL